MSELKHLAWTVQQSVEPLPFEQLERRGVRRRHRRQLTAVAAVAAATAAVVVAAVLLPSGGRSGTEQPPIATVPTSAPGYVLPTVDRSGVAVVNGPTAKIGSIVMATQTRWAADWENCETTEVCYAAVLSRDGVKAVAPARSVPYVPLKAGSEAIAVAPPRGQSLTPGEPTWSESVLFRLTAKGPVASRLKYAQSTATWQAGEILTDRIVPNQTVIVNLEDATLRMLDREFATSPVTDSTGRTWILTGGGRTDAAWTDDNGKTWDSQLLDPDHSGGRLAVSPDGRTVVVTTLTGDSPVEVIGTMKLSTDRGAHWTTVRNHPWSRGAGPVAFDDGTALVLGERVDDPSPRLYRVQAGDAQPQTASPGLLTEISGDAKLLYGPQVYAHGTTRVATSTDRGATWRNFVPR